MHVRGRGACRYFLSLPLSADQRRRQKNQTDALQNVQAPSLWGPIWPNVLHAHCTVAHSEIWPCFFLLLITDLFSPYLYNRVYSEVTTRNPLSRSCLAC